MEKKINSNEKEPNSKIQNEIINDKTDNKKNDNTENKDDIKINNIKEEEKFDNKNEIIINENLENENKEYFETSFLFFKSHLDNCESAIKIDVKNMKIMQTPKNNRDLLWEIFLGVLTYKSSEDWNKTISEERIIYYESKKLFITKDIEDFINTKKVKDKYSEYFKYKEILSKEDYDFLDIIKIDVFRTFQKEELFKEEKIQKILINILFIFAKQNKEIGYRQGMSDLCAIFLYVLYKNKNLDSNFIVDHTTFIFYLLHSNNEFLEHDTYILFSRFMLKGYMQFFLYNDEKFLNGELSTIDSEKRKLLSKNEIINAKDSELKKRIFLVYYQEFPLIDKQLYQFMVDKIEPEIFMVKWYICIFSREFSFPQILELWDLILYQQFLEDKNTKKQKNNDDTNHYYKFIDYIILSMLINIKSLLMSKNSSTELMAFLMKYPKNIEFKNIYLKALEIYNKSKGNIKI